MSNLSGEREAIFNKHKVPAKEVQTILVNSPQGQILVSRLRLLLMAYARINETQRWLKNAPLHEKNKEVLEKIYELEGKVNQIPQSLSEILHLLDNHRAEVLDLSDQLRNFRIKIDRGSLGKLPSLAKPGPKESPLKSSTSRKEKKQ